MDKASFDDYVANRYQNQLEYYEKASSKNQKKYRRFQWVLIILSALTPVLAALSGVVWSQDNKDINVFTQILVVLVSSIVAILTTGLKTFNYQELWISYRATYEQLKPEVYYYEFNVGAYSVPGIDKESLFVSQVEAILNKEHVQWTAAKKQPEQDGKENSTGESK